MLATQIAHSSGEFWHPKSPLLAVVEIFEYEKFLSDFGFSYTQLPNFGYLHAGEMNLVLPDSYYGNQRKHNESEP